MRPLERCTAIHGNIFYSAIAPMAAVYENAVFLPREPPASFDDDVRWGVYANGENISLAAYRRGPHQDRVGQSQRTGARPEIKIPADRTYIYVGAMIFHHGHFLLTSLARLWPLLRLKDRNFKLVHHGDHDMETICRHVPVADAALKAFGLTPDDFLRPMEPTVFERLHIPAPSFEETNSAHQVHGDVGEKIGRFLRQGRPARAFANPVMFSKARLASGVARFVNEDEITGHLARRGVEVLSPETMSLADQIDVFESAPALVSYAGSALHTSLLAERPAVLVGLNLNAVVGSSQILIDALKGNEAVYLHPTNTRASAAGSTFAAGLHVDDPIAVSDAILREIDVMTGWRARLKRAIRKPDPLKALAYPGVQSLWPQP